MKRRLAVAAMGMITASMFVPMSTAGAAPVFTERGDCPKGEKYFLFEYNDSATVGVDSGCSKKNDVTGAEVPGLIANKLHVSCSDKFIGGVGQKSDLGSASRRVVAYTIMKDGKVECGQGDPIPAGGIVGAAILAGAAAGYVALRQRRNSDDDIPVLQ
jgi:hypothetical protein